jgi:hypothetical protein
LRRDLSETITGKGAKNALARRPDEEEVAKYVAAAKDFLSQLSLACTPLAEYFSSDDEISVTRKYRRKDGGHLLFRPVGFRLATEVICMLLSRGYGLGDAIVLFGKLPLLLSDTPYCVTIWSMETVRMNPRERTVARDLMLYILGERQGTEELRLRYAKALDIAPEEVVLPSIL